MPVQCLQIPVFKNFDNDTDTESFAIVDPVSTFRVLITIFKNCLNGEIKLAGGRDNTEGVLKICKDGSFKNLCSSIWTVQNANDACKKLGFISSQSNHTQNFSYMHISVFFLFQIFSLCLEQYLRMKKTLQMMKCVV